MTAAVPADEVKAMVVDTGVIGIVRAPSADEAVALARQIWAAGAPVVEVALTTPGGLQAIERLSAERLEGQVLGAGTVLDGTTARLAILAGARLLVTPTLAAEVIEVAQRYGVATVIGCGTATEMLHATTLGADLVKVFPASQWTPRVLSDLLQALPQLECVPTGGVTLQDAVGWITAGARAVGMGSALTKGSDPSASVRTLLQELRAARSGR